MTPCCVPIENGKWHVVRGACGQGASHCLASFFTQIAQKTQIKTPCAACWNVRNKCE